MEEQETCERSRVAGRRAGEAHKRGAGKENLRAERRRGSLAEQDWTLKGKALLYEAPENKTKCSAKPQRFCEKNSNKSLT